MKAMFSAAAGITPTELIRKIVTDTKPEGGSMFLDDFCRQLPNCSRADCVATLKNSKDVLFIVGRKGHMSRIVFGRMKDDYRQAPSFKSPMASGPIRSHTPSLAPQRNHTSQAPQRAVFLNDSTTDTPEIDPTMFRLRIVVKGQEVFVPIDELELVLAQ